MKLSLMKISETKKKKCSFGERVAEEKINS
jgi:hypothetical protein